MFHVPCSSSKTAFTLIEVLLAVVLLGVSLTVFLNAASTSLAFIHEAQNYERARTYFHRLELLEPLDLEKLEEGRDRGSLDVDGPDRVSWSRTVTPVGKEEDELFKIRTEVRWGEGFTESIETYLHKPTAMEGGWVREPAE
jgi:prepilin-type N-terminal cleavage/methylation domain-containing protein